MKKLYYPVFFTFILIWIFTSIGFAQECNICGTYSGSVIIKDFSYGQSVKTAQLRDTYIFNDDYNPGRLIMRFGVPSENGGTMTRDVSGYLKGRVFEVNTRYDKRRNITYSQYWMGQLIFDGINLTGKLYYYGNFYDKRTRKYKPGIEQELTFTAKKK